MKYYDPKKRATYTKEIAREVGLSEEGLLDARLPESFPFIIDQCKLKMKKDEIS